ncbi:unnamed protein product [Parnassius apollo]|uniref:(apollo) hypothetical protein n=1 Tax=Parnassius apollo TaxID=110799 RepID=A0A8S3Y442_PARAO|nr:unnamed protein product [Parnassius apollo]
MHRFFAELEPFITVTEQNLADQVRYILRSNIFDDAELERLRREIVPSSDENDTPENTAPLIAQHPVYVDTTVDIPVMVDSDDNEERMGENEEHIGKSDFGNMQYASRKSTVTSSHIPKQAESG